MASSTAALLPALRPLGELEQGAFDALVAHSAAIAAGTRTAAELHADPALRTVDVSGALHRALLSLFLEAARANTTTEMLVSELTSVLSEPRARAIASILAEGGPTLCGAVAAAGFGPAEIVDVHWQRRTVAGPADGGRALYAITLTTRRLGDATPSTIQFSASIEQLSALVAELKNALHQVERECAE